jgi:hypothetical protein
MALCYAVFIPLQGICATGSKEGTKELSFLQIVKNYENAIKKLGGKILLSETRILNAKIEKDKGGLHPSG